MLLAGQLQPSGGVEIPQLIHIAHSPLLGHTSQNQMLATLKQQGLIDPDIFISQSNELAEQLRAVKLKKERLLAVDGDNTIAQTRELMEILNDGPDFLDSFDAELFGELVETIIVESNERIRFRLKNGLELSETIERTVR